MKQELTRAERLDAEIGARVRHVRKLRGMTQTQLGAAIGVTFQQIQKYERGANRISTSALILLARTLDVSPEALLGADEPVASDFDMALLSEEGAYELIQAVTQIPSDEQRRIVIQLAKELADAGLRPSYSGSDGA